MPVKFNYKRSPKLSVKFRVGDLVRIISQPQDLPVRVQGDVGIVEEMNDAYAKIQTITNESQARKRGERRKCEKSERA